MSAFVVNKEHIDALVDVALKGPSDAVRSRMNGRWEGPTWWTTSERISDPSLPWERMNLHRHDLRDWGNADDVGQMLVDQNVTSVQYRYPDTLEGGSMPGPIEEYYREPYVFAELFGKRPTIVDALSLIHCYDYQSCEDPGWRISEAHAFCEALTDSLTRCLPGYSEAPWTWPAREEVNA